MTTSNRDSACFTLNDWRIPNRISIPQLAVYRGEFLHLLGPNGAGKSTLIESMAGLLRSEDGEITVFKRVLSDWSLPELAAQRAYLGQHISCQFELSVADVIGFFSGHNTIPSQIEHALEVSDLLSMPLNQLSGGQQQRVYIARTLLQVWSASRSGNAIILLDEPLQHLDIIHQQSCLQLLKDISAMGNTVVISSHDINLSNQFASSIALLRSGELLVKGDPVEVMKIETLKATFGCDFHLVYSENEYEFFHPRVNS